MHWRCSLIDCCSWCSTVQLLEHFPSLRAQVTLENGESLICPEIPPETNSMLMGHAVDERGCVSNCFVQGVHGEDYWIHSTCDVYREKTIEHLQAKACPISHGDEPKNCAGTYCAGLSVAVPKMFRSRQCMRVQSLKTSLEIVVTLPSQSSFFMQGTSTAATGGTDIRSSRRACHGASRQRSPLSPSAPTRQCR